MKLKKIFASKTFKIALALAIVGALAFAALAIIHKKRLLAPKTPLYRLVETSAGFPIIINAYDTYLGSFVVGNKGYPQHLDKYYNLFLPQGSTIVDIGSAYGYHTVLFAKKAGKFSTIYSIEPRTDIAKIARLNINMNKADNVILMNKLLFSKDITYYINALPSSSYWNLLQKKPNITAEQAQQNNIYAVQAHQLDRLVRNVFGVNLMRISGHGTELEIIEGAKSIIEKSPNIGIFIHWNKSAISTYSNAEKVVRQLADIGFSFWNVNSNGILKVLSVSDLLSLKDGDIIITKKSIVQQ